jgi:hypothetical protein
MQVADMTKLQTIKRKNGNITHFMYFPKGDLQKAGFSQDEELLIEAKHGCITIRNSLDASEIQLPENGTAKEPGIFALNNTKVLEAVRDFGEPLDAQKELAIQVKNFLDYQIDRELREKGYLSDATRRWVTELSEILERIQKAIYGDKTVNFHTHKISHSFIAMKIREASRNEQKGLSS